MPIRHRLLLKLYLVLLYFLKLQMKEILVPMPWLSLTKKLSLTNHLNIPCCIKL